MLVFIAVIFQFSAALALLCAAFCCDFREAKIYILAASGCLVISTSAMLLSAFQIL